MLAVITATILSCSALYHYPNEWLATSGRPKSHAVVLARVASVTEGRISEFSLEIEHVYGSDRSLQGSMIVGKRYERGNAGVFTLHPAPKVDEIGIWLVPNSTDRGEVDAYTNHKMSQIIPLRLPARRLTRAGDDNYHQALEWAKTVETLESLDSDNDRIEQFKSFALGEHATLSTWAINVLAQISPEVVQDLSGRLLGPDVPTRSQIALDEAMMEIAPDDWVHSEQREAILRHWLIDALDETDGHAVLIRLNVVAQRGQINPERLFEFLSTIINGPYPQPIRGQAIRQLQWIINEPDPKNDTIALLRRILLSDEDTSLKFTSVHALANLKKADAPQLAQIHMLQEYYGALAMDAEEKDAQHIRQIGKLLGELIQKLDPPPPLSN